MSDLDFTALFPDLAAAISTFEQQNKAPGSGHLSSSGEQSQVTDEQIERYFQMRQGPYRAPINPAISGQQLPAEPQFFNNGRQAPPSTASYTEAPESGQGESVSAPPVPETPPPPPGGDLFTPPSSGDSPSPEEPTPSAPSEPAATDELELGGKRVPRDRAEAWAALGQRVQDDPELAKIISGYFTTGKVPPTAQPTAPAQAAPEQWAPSAEDLSDPVLKSMWDTIQRQKETLARVERQSTETAASSFQAAQRSNQEIVSGSVSQFQERYKLADDVMDKVRGAAARSMAVDTYMKGLDPITGEVVEANPYKAVERALEIGYWMTPEARQLEFTRQLSRNEADTVRKQKLAGISGASGSVPRTQPAPQPGSPESQHALIGEVADMLNGSWTERS